MLLKRIKLLKQGLQATVISDKWSCYCDDDVVRARFVKDKMLDDLLSYITYGGIKSLIISFCGSD